MELYKWEVTIDIQVIAVLSEEVSYVSKDSKTVYVSGANTSKSNTDGSYSQKPMQTSLKILIHSLTDRDRLKENVGTVRYPRIAIQYLSE